MTGIEDCMRLMNVTLAKENSMIQYNVYCCMSLLLKPRPNDANIFAQQMPTMLGINVGIVWPSMLGIVG